ncbi:MAG: hypothetical protein ABJC09_09830 [Terriglobia bacterium]
MELIAEKEEAAKKAREEVRLQKLTVDLPAFIDNQVGEQIGKLEDRLVTDFKLLGDRAVGESTKILAERLGGRLASLEKIAAMQSVTLLELQNSSKATQQRIGSVVDEIEMSLAGAVPGFKLPDPRQESGIHPQFQLARSSELVKADAREMTGADSRFGSCPGCTSANVRRAKRTGLFEEFLRLFFIAPFRCRSCRHKFYRF